MYTLPKIYICAYFHFACFGLYINGAKPYLFFGDMLLFIRYYNSRIKQMGTCHYFSLLYSIPSNN